MSTPKLIALCGNPKAGKSEVQRILHQKFGIVPIDDGEVLREFAINYLNLYPEDVYTQEGKMRSTEILGVDWNHRKLLGDFGAVLEGMFGEHIMPFIATRNLASSRMYSFGSVRKTQGEFYKNNNGVVIEVTRPGAEPSGYSFDTYDRSLIDLYINNDGDLVDLERKVGMIASIIGI